MYVRKITALLAGALLAVTSLGDADARKKRRPAGKRIWVKTLTKARFGVKASSKRRGRWVKLRTIKVSGKVAAILGTRVKARGKLTRGNEFLFEIRMKKGTLLVDQSEMWKGRYMWVEVRQTAVGLTARLKTRWRWRKWRGPGRKRRR